MDQSGLSELMKAITSNCKDLSSVMADMESTGCYQINLFNLFSFLSHKGINAVVINPLLIANFANLALRKAKADKKDSFTIAKFILIYKDSIKQLSISQDTKDLRDIARESLCNLIASTKNEIRAILQTLSPELESHCNIFTPTILSFLKEFPSARIIEAAEPVAIAKDLESPSRGRKVFISADEIIKAAKASVGSLSLAKENILRGKITTLLHLTERLDEITEMLSSYCQSMMLQDLQIITSINGIDTTTAATFLAEIGNINSFPSYKNLIAFAGIDPSVYQSGKFEETSRISKRGTCHLRRVIYLMNVKVIRVNAFFKTHFLKRRRDDLPFKKAVNAAAHKLIRTIFAMLSHKSYFRAKENSL